MKILPTVLLYFIVFEHVGFLILEMFFWSKPLGLKIFRRTQRQADDSAVLALNQGLYNGFLAAGLMWGLVCKDPGMGYQIKIFFLCCISIAGLVGGLSSSRSILYVQLFPALVALVLLGLIGVG